MSSETVELTITWPRTLSFLALRYERQGWQAGLRAGPSVRDETGSSLEGMSAYAYGETPQAAFDAAVARMHELIAEINREIPLRAQPKLRQSESAQKEELLALLGL